MNLKYLLVIFLAALTCPSSAFNVTFRLQMVGVNGFTTPEVNGTFNAWCGACNPMSDANNDGIWETTISLPAGYFEYKYSADNWSQQESLSVGATCTATTGEFTNRTLNITGDVVLPVVCWGSCSSCTSFNVTFQVNMASVNGFNTPYVSGGFNDWCGNCHPMTDPDGDNIWSATIPLSSGYYEYKFSYDNWAGAENLPVGASCTITSFGFTNRFINVGQTQVLPAVCWETCDQPSQGGGPSPQIQIALTTGSNPSCEMSELVFTASATNLSSTPYYQWQIDGANAGANSPTFTNSDLTNGQVVSCILIGGTGCTQGSPVTSNTITVNRQAIVNPSVTIAASPASPWCSGQEITFTASPTNGGTNPTYQWFVDGQSAGNGGSNFVTSSLLPNQNVTCSMLSNATCQTSTWNMIWNDEFNGTALDVSKWTPELGASGWGNNEWQNYTNSSNNIQFNNGQLHIVARNDGPVNTQYTSARLITKNKFSFKYGRITGRLQIPLGQGIWPAFWMLGANIDQVPWPGSGEIDIMEHINNENTIYGTAHWNNNGLVSNSGSVNTAVNGFHDYTVEWDSLAIRFIMDGVTYHQHTISSGNGSFDEFTKPFFLLLNVAVGGNWPGYPNASTVFPVSMDVDYVRVWQRNTNTTAAPTLSNAITFQAASSSSWYLDNDGDGFGSISNVLVTCDPPANYVSNNLDCDDNALSRNPNAIELCNGLDDNCNGSIDEGFADMDNDNTADCMDTDTDGDGVNNNLDCSPSDGDIWQLATAYIDLDSDGYGYGSAIVLCIGSILPDGYVSNNQDCDDGNAGVNTGGNTTISAIEGATMVCRNQSFVYSIDAVAGDSQYNWTWPSGATAVVSENTITLTFLNAFTGGNLCVSVASACGADAEECKALTVTTSAPGSIGYIEGTGSVCTNVNYTYTIAELANASAYVWTAPANAVLVSGQGTTSATFSFNSSYVNGNISVRASNCYGQSGLRTRYITKRPVASKPGVVAGLSIVCPGSEETYSILPTSNSESYTWTAPAGATITSGQGGLSVVVTFESGFISGNLQVVSNNCSGSSGARLKALARKALPGTVGLISGNKHGACSTLINTYTVPAIQNTDAYIWTPPANATIVSGQGTTSVQLAFAPEFVSGQLTVRGQNCSGISALIIPLGIEKLTPVPTVINGPLSGVCSASTHTFSTPTIAGVSNYIWTIPSGATINGASNGPSISVTFPSPFVSGYITVRSSTSCYTSAAKSIAVAANLVTPGAITGTTTGLMGGASYSYSINAMAGASSYNWIVPNGWMITANTGTSITVTVPSGGFTNAAISVSAVNICGTSVARTLNLTGVVGAPGIIVGASTFCETGSELTYELRNSNMVSYNWQIINGKILSDEHEKNVVRLVWEESEGELKAIGTDTNGNDFIVTIHAAMIDCSDIDASSDDELVDQPKPIHSMRIYPNPTRDDVKLEFKSLEEGIISLEIFNSMGQIMRSEQHYKLIGSNTLEITMNQLPAGVYYFVVSDGRSVQHAAVVKE